jgi:hypothetical protein
MDMSEKMGRPITKRPPGCHCIGVRVRDGFNLTDATSNVSRGDRVGPVCAAIEPELAVAMMTTLAATAARIGWRTRTFRGMATTVRRECYRFVTA